MVTYTCNLCLKIFNKKSGYKRHVEYRKTPCIKQNTTEALDLHTGDLLALDLHSGDLLAHDLHQKPAFKNKESLKINVMNIVKMDKNEKIICEYCNKCFVKQYGLNRHLIKCNVKEDIIIKLKMENEKLKNIDVENEKLKIENEKLKMELEKLNNSIINKSTLINNGTINIKIVNYGEEDLTKLDINKILKYENSFIEMVFRDIHCNSDLPEYQNILLPSLTRYDLYVKFNDEWLKRNKKEILTERYTTIRGYIMDLYDKEKEINKGKADNYYFHFLKQIKLIDPTNSIYKPQEEKKIIDGIANVLYNHKNNIKSTDKNPLLVEKKN